MTDQLPSRTRLAGDHLIVLLHGLGCGVGSLDSAFTADPLAKFSLCAVGIPPQATIDQYAEAAVREARKLGHDTVTMVGHSMGGAAAVLAAQELGCPVISLEGNLVAEDCGLVSRRIADQALGDFVGSGYSLLLSGLDACDTPDLTQWAQWMRQTDPADLHAAARSLVEWSDSGHLLNAFRSLPRRTYICGARSDVSHLLPHLTDSPSRNIPEAGHFLMVDNPAQLWATVAGLADSPRSESDAQALHNQRRAADPDHDLISCWCCCIDCDFDHRLVVGERIEEQP